MATTRATGYVVTAAVWNAVLSGLSDAGVFTGTITTSGTATFNGGFAVQNTADVPRFYAVPSGPGIRIVGRTSDSIGGLQFMDTSQATEYLNINARSTGTFFETGSTARPFTFTGGRVNSCAVQPAVIAYLSADQTGVIGGTDINFDTEILDQAGNFSSPTFTAPVAGAYVITGAVQIKNSSGSNATTGEQIALVVRVNSSTIYSVSGSKTPLNNGEAITLPVAAILSLSASDTVHVRLQAGGGQSLTAVGSASSRLTWVSIRLLV